MVRFVLSNFAEKRFSKLSKKTQERIRLKLHALKKHDDILSVLKRLTDFEPATHRLRIGSYRLILQSEENESEENTFVVLDVGHRKDIYR